MITRVYNPIPTAWVERDRDNDAAFGLFEFYDENGTAKFETQFSKPEDVRNLIRVAEWALERMEWAEENGYDYLIDHCNLILDNNNELTVDDILGEDGI